MAPRLRRRLENKSRSDAGSGAAGLNGGVLVSLVVVKRSRAHFAVAFKPQGSFYLQSNQVQITTCCNGVRGTSAYHHKLHRFPATHYSLCRGLPLLQTFWIPDGVLGYYKEPRWKTTNTNNENEWSTFVNIFTKEEMCV